MSTSISFSKNILSKACSDLGLSVVDVKKCRYCFQIYLRNDIETLNEKRDQLQFQLHQLVPSRFYIILAWSRKDSDTFDKPGGKAMDGKGVYSGLNVIDRETELGSKFTFLF